MSLTDVERRIAKLLAQAEGTTHDAEARTYSEAAEKLMLKWGIDEAIARAKHGDQPAKPESIVKVGLELRGTYAQSETGVAGYVVAGLGNLQGVVSDYDGRKRHVMYWIVGYESEVHHAVTLIKSLLVQVKLEQARWWRAMDQFERDVMLGTAMKKFKAKRQFHYSFGAAVYDRLDQQRRALIQDTGDTTGTELALQDRGLIVERELARFFPHLGHGGRSLKGSYAGGAAGREAGARADLGGDRKLNGGPRQLGR